MPAPSKLPAYAEAQARTGHGGVWLLRSGDYAVVLVETRDREWVEILREHVEGNFSHSVTELGIEDAIKRTEEYSQPREQIRIKIE